MSIVLDKIGYLCDISTTMKYAIIETGGKQYKVQKGDVINVERLKNAKPKISFDKVVAICSKSGIKTGNPYIQGATVKAEVLAEEKGKKTIIVKFRRRKSYEKKTGHRQIYTKVEIGTISED